MSNPEEHKEFYYVDPGIGRKLHNCPYSLSKEGNDIRDFIIPPKGYEVSGFIFFPREHEHEGDGFYDGKIVAQYKKKPLLPRLVKPSLYLLAFLSIVGLLGIMAYFLNSRPKPAFEMSNTQKPNTGSPGVSSDSTLQTQVYCTSSSNTEVVAEQEPEEVVVGKESKEAIVEKEQKEVLAEKKPEKDIVKTEQKEVLVQKEQKEVPVEKKPEKDIVKKEQKEVPVEKKPEKEETLTKGTFQQEFWDLIHKRDPRMDSYHNLYVNNKGKVKGEEFDYLRLVILENTKAYKEWMKKLKAVPESELQDINTIAALREALK